MRRSLLLLPLLLAACVSETEADMLARPLVRSADSVHRLLSDNLGAEEVSQRFGNMTRDAGRIFAQEAAALQRVGPSGVRLVGSEVDRVTVLPAETALLATAEVDRLAGFSLHAVEPELAPERMARRVHHLMQDLVPVLRLDHRPLPEPADPERRTSLDDDRPVPSTLERILRRIWH